MHLLGCHMLICGNGMLPNRLGGGACPGGGEGAGAGAAGGWSW